MKAGRVSRRINSGVDLGAQAATALPNGLSVLRLRFFAPALCQLALTMHESIRAYSLSASCAKALKMRLHTPVRSSGSGADTPTESHQSALARSFSTECQRASGTARFGQTVDCSAHLRQNFSNVLATPSPYCTPIDHLAVHIFWSCLRDKEQKVLFSNIRAFLIDDTLAFTLRDKVKINKIVTFKLQKLI